jgi:hypothetical protein
MIAMDSILSRLPSWASTAVITDAVRNPKSLLALAVAVVLVLYGLSVGRTRALVSLLSIYFAYLLTVLFPFLPWLMQRVPSRFEQFTPVALFVVLYVLTFMILTQSLLHGRVTLGEISVWHVLIISVVQVGLLTSICMSLLPNDESANLLGPLSRWFGSQRALWSWAVASLLIMPFMRAHRRE